MSKKVTIFLLSVLFAAPVLAAEPTLTNRVDPQEKTLSGMSIVGNDEAPKSLYIVPWKSSEIGIETSLDRLANKDAVPLDRDVFRRQLEFYQVSHNIQVRR